MWQKLIAATLCLTGSCGFGFSLCREMTKAITELKIQKQMLSYITGEISYLHRPLEEIFDILSERLDTPFDIFLKNISDEMKSRNGRTLKNIWNNNATILEKQHVISKLNIKYLKRTADCFECEGDRIQVETFELLIQEIDQEIENLAERKKENSRLISVLSALTGVLCIVLFL
jgi:stage III sporulation protein AB